MNEKNLRRMLEEECKLTLEDLSAAEAGSDEAETQIRRLKDLHNLYLNQCKMENDEVRNLDELHLKAQELQIKEDETKADRKGRIVSYVLTAAGILVPVIAGGYWMAKGLEFEQTGSYTSKSLRWVQDHLRIFKK